MQEDISKNTEDTKTKRLENASIPLQFDENKDLANTS
jgi:hypothetical protein